MVFFAGALLVIPVGTIFASRSRGMRELVFAAMVFSTAFIGAVNIHFIDRMWYVSMTRGFEISFVDFLAIILILSTLLNAQRERFRLFWPASLGLMLAYLGYCCLSVAFSDPKLFGAFELMQIVRGLLAFLAVAWYVRSERDARILCYAIAAAVMYEGCLGLIQRYVYGILRVNGTFPNDNQLADYCCMVSPLLIVMIFSGTRLPTKVFFATAWALTGISVVLSISRMGAALFAVGTVAMLLYGLATQLSAARIALIIALGLVGGGILLRGWDRIEGRHKEMTAVEEAGESSAGRTVYYVLAWRAVAEDPFGVGLNNWSWWFTTKDGAPYIEDVFGRNSPFAHTLYGLTLGELGWPGFSILLALWCQWFVITGRWLFRRGAGLVSRLGVACFCSIGVVALNNLTECTLRSQHMFFMFNILLGFAVAARHQHRTGGGRQISLDAE